VADGGIASADGWYIVTDTNAGANTYTLTATPQGVQANDTKCANLTMTHTGVRGASGDTPDICW